MQYEKELTTAIAIAKEAGEIMRTYFYGEQQRVIKDDGTPLTIADTTINRMVIERLHAVFPDDIVIGEEESTGGYGTGRRWFCDPIDGTKAFTWGTTTAMFSLGLVVDGAPVLGVCYEPMLDQLYQAVKGNGAYRNDTRIHVNDEIVTNGIVAVTSSLPHLHEGRKYIDTLIDKHIEMAPLSGAVAKTIRIAEGRFIGYIGELGNTYDVAAAHVILEEAGGMITGLDGKPYDYTKPFRGTIATNGLVHDELVEIVGAII